MPIPLLDAAVQRGLCHLTPLAYEGSNPDLPYIPVLSHGDRVERFKGFAFATREEAVGYAEQLLEKKRVNLRRRLLCPRQMDLREAHGLPRDQFEFFRALTGVQAEAA